MKFLYSFFSGFNFSIFDWPQFKHRMTVFCTLLLVLVSVSYCFRENILQRVDEYNSEEFTAEVPYNIEIISTLPAAGETGVSINSHIDVVFSDNIDMLTVNGATTFIVNDGIGTMSGSFTYDSALKTVTFTPAGGFAASTTYTVTLTTGIKNMVGESMAADYSWSFTTAAGLVPEIYVLSPLLEIFSGDTYDYGIVVTATTKTETFTIGNSGSGNLVINAGGITVTGTDFVVFPDPTPITILPGSTSTFTVDFTPAVAGLKNAVLTIVSNDADESSFLINLTGTALDSPEPEIQITNGGVILISPTSTVDFGTVAAGDTGTIALIMYNLGTANLVVNSFTLGGTNPDLFSTDFGAVPAAITPGSTKTFNVSFSSPSKINARATISFVNNDTDESTFIIKLKGRVR